MATYSYLHDRERAEEQNHAKCHCQSHHTPCGTTPGICHCAAVGGVDLVDSNFFCLGTSTESANNIAHASFAGVMMVGLDKSTVGGTKGSLRSISVGRTDVSFCSMGMGRTQGSLHLEKLVLGPYFQQTYLSPQLYSAELQDVRQQI